MDEPRERPVAALPLPAPLDRIVDARAWFRDAVGESGGEVYRLHRAGAPDLYLKRGCGEVADAVVDEMVRLRWLQGRTAVPAVRGFVLDGADAWLLTEALPGRTAWQVLTDDPSGGAAIAQALGAHLAEVHAIPIVKCPFDAGLPLRMAQAWQRIEAGAVDADDFDDDHEGWTPQAVWDEMTALLPVAPDLVVTHGDYSLDNILVADGAVVGCIDWDRAGVADRYQDLAILANCLDEFGGDLRDAFFAGYGLADPDVRKLRLYRCLDEMF